MSTLTGTHTHHASTSPPSLPSFAQTFSNINTTTTNNTNNPSASGSVPNLARDSDQGNSMHTLPPIHNYNKDPSTKKRPIDNDDDDQERVKRESMSPSPAMELDQLDDSPSPPNPNPATRRPTKRRRVNSVQVPATADSPASPMVVGFELPSSDQGALDQVRATFSIKQKQKEMIDQRRGSAAGLLQSTPAPPRPAPPPRRQSATGGTTSASPSQHPSPQQQHPQPQPPPPPQPTHHFSPPQNALPAPNPSFSTSRRRRSTLHPSSPPSRLPAPAPAPILTPGPSSSFPPPHRIAKSTPRIGPPKPLTLAPLAHSRRLEPLVHSAPVIGGSRFPPMRVPELPPIPITPRRISSIGAAGGGTASVAIAKSGGMRTGRLGVPPTPAFSSAQPQQQQEEGKAGFLKLFENFYDSLADSRLLKQWLQEQLTKSNALLEQLETRGGGGGVTMAQVEELVERRVAPLRNEVDGLKRRVGELEEMLYRERQRERGGRAGELEDEAGKRPGGYVFPERERRSSDASEPHGSFDQGRLSTSAVRLEGAGATVHVHPGFPGGHRPSPLGLERERERERERRRSAGQRETNGASV